MSQIEEEKVPIAEQKDEKELVPQLRQEAAKQPQDFDQLFDRMHKDQIEGPLYSEDDSFRSGSIPRVSSESPKKLNAAK